MALHRVIHLGTSWGGGAPTQAPNFVYGPAVPQVLDLPLHGVTLYGDNDNSDVELWQDYLFSLNDV